MDRPDRPYGLREESVCDFFCNRHVYFVNIPEISDIAYIFEELEELAMLLMPFIIVDLGAFEMFLMRRNMNPYDPFRLMRMDRIMFFEIIPEAMNKLGLETKLDRKKLCGLYLVPNPYGLYIVMETEDREIEEKLERWDKKTLTTYLMAALIDAGAVEL